MLSTHSLRPKASSVSVFEREVQEFLFDFLPALLREMFRHLGQGFSVEQEAAVASYFQEMVTLTAIAFPEHRWRFWKRGTHRIVRGLHRQMLAWCAVKGDGEGSKARRTSIRDGIQDRLGEIVKAYKASVPAAFEYQRPESLAHRREILDGALRQATGIGLLAIDQFAERVSMQNREYLTRLRSDRMGNWD